MSSGYITSIFIGTWLTFQVALGSLLVAVVMGLAGATAKLSAQPLLRGVGGVYSTVIRGIPDLVLMLLIFYGAYMTETFRGAILAIPKGQAEAGLAYGMSPFRVFTTIVLPQMVRLALPGFTNNWLVLLKSTALVSLLGLQDLTYLAKQAGAAARGTVPNAPLLFMAFAALLYLILSSISMVGLRVLEKRYSMGVKRGTL
jgi:arginine/ornithine transport system permease protein